MRISGFQRKNGQTKSKVNFTFNPVFNSVSRRLRGNLYDRLRLRRRPSTLSNDFSSLIDPRVDYNCILQALEERKIVQTAWYIGVGRFRTSGEGGA